MFTYRNPLPPFEPGNLNLSQIQGQAPLEFYILRSTWDRRPGASGQAATIIKGKMFIPSRHLFVWSYAGYWARIEKGIEEMAFYKDKATALAGLMRWKLVTGLAVLVDEKLL